MVYKNHAGYTNLTYRAKPINDSSIFQLASLSKQFTAAAVMLLYQQGKLSYDDPVTKYIDGFPYKDVTVRQLLHHTSGVPNYMWLAERKWEGKTPPDNREMIEMMCRYDLKPHFKPGTRYKYSNTGYMILVGIVEQISGQPIDAFLNEQFFSKLGMSNTYARSFSDNPIHRYKKDPGYPGELKGYRYSRRRYVAIPPTVNDGAVGDKGIYSTGADLLRWDQALEKHFVLADTTLKAAYKKGVTTRGDTIPYGFGYHIPKKKKDLKAYHNGVWNGFTNTFRKYHKDSLTIILLSNNSFRGITPAINGLKNIID
jgi:CubicO group peptidase (beta-lactamase class C family)